MSDQPDKAPPGKHGATATGPAADRVARDARRADALRRNLGRRKAQARARADGAAASTDGTPSAVGGIRPDAGEP